MPENAANVVALSFMNWLQNDQDGERQRRYAVYREYYDGEHDTQLTKRIRAFLELKLGSDFRDNYCPVVVDSLVERLHVTGFRAGEVQSAVFWQWWKANRMDAGQVDTHQAATRDGDGYVIVEWDEERQMPKFTLELAHAGSDGVKFHYSDARRGSPICASKEWKVTDPADGGGYLRRKNLYFPDRIERYASDARINKGEWAPLKEDGKPWPEPWTRDGTDEGEPLGIPVVHFKYKAHGYNFGRSRLADVTPLQNQLNKAIIDLVGVGDTSGFPMLWATGDEFKDGIDVGPGRVMYSQKSEAKFGVIPAADLQKLVNYKNDIIMDMARVSNTPLSRFQISGQIAAEGTQKQMESGLVSDAETTQLVYGNAWEDCMAMGRKLNNAFGEEGTPELDEEQPIDTVWKSAESRNDKEVAEIVAIWIEKGNVPDVIAWKHFGLTDDEIETAEESEQYKALKAGRAMMMTLGEGQDGG